ncbi:MAG: hypothetical protein IJI58_01170 [Bacilli bacterium]|nr:hypothetical protein [Bacilli bacterium]
MRIKEFIIFIGIFTVCYIMFFIVLDKVSNIRTKKSAIKKAKSLMTLEQYAKFASFYGVQATTSIDNLLKAYTELLIGNNWVISEKAKLYNVSNLELVIMVLYIEYLGLINKRMISIEMDSIKKTSFVEQNMVQKYNTYFKEKKDYDSIIEAMGNKAANDLATMNDTFLMPGIRLINSKLYYVGDYL